MKKSIKLNYWTLVAVILMCFVIFPILAVSNNSYISTEAEDTYVESEELNIAHITDTHYFPLRYCYNGTDGEYYAEMKADTKIQIESSTVIKTLLAEILDNGKDIDYLMVTGDISKDGERASHIDMANALRKLQNDIRANRNADFQIFVVPGNHDLYNPSTYSYGGDGIEKLVKNVTRKDFSIIYSSLGYPDITNEEAAAFYTSEDLNVDLETLPYEAATGSFINSITASNLTIQYMYDENDSDYAPGELSYIATNEFGYSFLGIDEEDSNIVDGHVLTATVTNESKVFFTSNVNTNNKLIGFLHHNMVPQFSMEDSLLSGFIVNDWVTTADFFADLGARYVLSGHMHANSISHYMSFNNNQITDIETSAACSFDGGTRYLNLSLGEYGETYAEKLTVEFEKVLIVDFSYLINNGYITADYLASNDLTQFMNGNICNNFSEYAKYRIYENVIDNVLVKYLSPQMIIDLSEMVTGVIPDTFSGFSLASIKNMADQLILNLINEIETKVLADYVYSGANPLYLNGQNKLLGYLEELVSKFRAIELASDGSNIVDVLFFCYYASISGDLYSSVEDFPANIQEGIANLRNGTAVQAICDVLLDEETGIYRIIKGLLIEEMDLTEGLSTNQINAINMLCRTILKVEGFDATKVKVDELARAALALLKFDAIDLGTGSVIDFLDTAIESNLTESFTTGLGSIAANILVAFGTDLSPDVDYDAPMLVTMNNNSALSYLDVPVTDNPTMDNGKLPSMLTVSFGADPSTSKNFNWITDKRVSSSDIIYSTNADLTNGTMISGEFQIYAYSFPEIDLGVFATLGISELGRHSVDVVNLQAGTTYYYKVGSSSKNYWSPVYTMKTAPSDNSPFNVLLFTDPQGYTQSNYSDVMRILNDVDKVFPDGFDFTISAGDNVDNSKNIDHYDYLLNTDQAFWGNITQVNATGNHEVNTFEADENYTPSSNEVFASEYNNSLLYYNISAPEQDMLTGIYYSFDYSGVHFVVLNTNNLGEDKALSQAQEDWLISDLNSTAKEHKVVIMHKSLYSGGSHSYDSDIIAMRAQLTPIFSETRVSLVLAGHDHTYSVSYYLDENGDPIKSTNAGRSKIGDNGTLYITLGTIGNKFYSYTENEEVPIYYGEELHDMILSNPVFAKLSYDGKDLYYEAYDYNLLTGEIRELKPQNNAGVIVLIVCGGLVLSGGSAMTVIYLKKKSKAVIPA